MCLHSLQIQSQFLAKTTEMMSHILVRVTYGKQNSVVKTSSFVSFSIFEEWVRCRFGIERTRCLIFKDSSGNEIIPTFSSDNKLSEIYVEVARNFDTTEHNKKLGQPFDTIDFFSVSFLYPVIILAYFLVVFVSHKETVGPKYLFNYASPILTFVRVAKDHQLRLYADMYAAFVTWPVSDCCLYV